MSHKHTGVHRPIETTLIETETWTGPVRFSATGGAGSAVGGFSTLIASANALTLSSNEAKFFASISEKQISIRTTKSHFKNKFEFKNATNDTGAHLNKNETAKTQISVSQQ